MTQVVQEPTGVDLVVRRRGVAAACLANAIEWYDFSVYAAFATIIGAVFFSATDATTALSAAFVAYGIALFMRPLGAVVFALWGDLRGRRPALLATVVVMAATTTGVALLPGYAAIGVAAPLLLVTLRAVQGVAVGGELGVAAVFLAESSSHGRPGRTAAWHTATMALGIAAGSALASLMAVVFTPVELQAGWWRVAFLLALPLGMVGFVLRRRAVETLHVSGERTGPTAARDTVRRVWTTHRAGLARGFCLIAAASVGFNTFFIFLPNRLISSRAAGLSSTMLLTAISLAVAAGIALVLGRLSDAVGRRPVVITAAAVLAVGAPPMSVLAFSGSVPGLFLAQLVVGAAVAGMLSMSMLVEQFPAVLRSTGVALSAGLATAVLGGTAPLIDQALLTASGRDVAPGLYVALLAVLALALLRRWPETAFEPLR